MNIKIIVNVCHRADKRDVRKKVIHVWANPISVADFYKFANYNYEGTE